MDSHAWYAGKSLKKAVEATGRVSTARQWVVALWLKAREEDMTLEDVVRELIMASEYEAAPTDSQKILRELGY